MSDLELSWLLDNTIAPPDHRAGRRPGSPGGGVDREINVTLDTARLEALNLTAPQVNSALRSASIDAPGGRAQVGGREQTVRVLGAAETVESLGAMVLSTGAGRTFAWRMSPAWPAAPPSDAVMLTSTVDPWSVSR